MTTVTIQIPDELISFYYGFFFSQVFVHDVPDEVYESGKKNMEAIKSILPKELIDEMEEALNDPDNQKIMKHEGKAFGVRMKNRLK